MERVLCPVCGTDTNFELEDLEANEVIYCENCEAELHLWRKDNGEWGAEEL